MSGPTSLIMTPDAAAVLMAAAAIRAAQAVLQGHERAQAMRDGHADQRRSRDREQHDAVLQGERAVRLALQQARESFAQLTQMAQQLGLADPLQATLPTLAADASGDALTGYVRGLEQLNAELRSILLTESAKRKVALADGAAMSLEQAIAAAPTAQSVAQRLVARLAHLDDVPESIHALARELDQTLPGPRAELLATELRSRIQSHAAAVQQRQVQEATALVVEQSLKDLGYQVEEMAQTLFVEGGVLHFRRADWGQYMVRMRVDAKASAANFNVIRAVAQGDNERSVLDHVAEDRWCAEFPSLLKTLQARGLALQVTRRLEAGELPVQLVSADKLPKFTTDEAPAAQVTALKQQAL